MLNSLIEFIKSSPTAWHATSAVSKRLKEAGFRELDERESWQLTPGDKVFVVRNGSSLLAAVMPQKKPKSVIAAASHTDSPALKLKPNAAYRKENMTMLAVDVYGSPLLNSWLNRDLGIAGRIVYEDGDGAFVEQLVNITEAPVVIPQLAIHLDREVSKQGLLLNRQEHLSALAALGATSEQAPSLYLESLLKKQHPFRQLYSSDLFLYPLEEPRFVGPEKEMLCAYRIDSLSSVHAVVEAFCSESFSYEETLKVCVFWDNEEIGSSNTAHGAESPFFAEVLERFTLALGLSREEYLQLFPSSLCVSVDLAHALHPNYMEKHEPQHRTLLGNGIVLKHSVESRYASDARTAGRVTALCRRHGIPLQAAIARADIPSGSTIGPIHANATGMPTVDIGNPQLSMHAIRELIASRDHLHLIQFLKAFYSQEGS